MLSALATLLIGLGVIAAGTAIIVIVMYVVGSVIRLDFTDFDKSLNTGFFSFTIFLGIITALVCALLVGMALTGQL